MMAGMEMLPTGCGYQGHEFGARYPDSECFGGTLYDMDNCDEPGTVNQPMDWIPCPMCHPKWAISQYKDQFRDITMLNSRGGIKYRYSKRDAAKKARALVRNIRANRKNGTEPWKGYANNER